MKREFRQFELRYATNKSREIQTINYDDDIGYWQVVRFNASKIWNLLVDGGFCSRNIPARR
jgi:hypothetical protein